MPDQSKTNGKLVIGESNPEADVRQPAVASIEGRPKVIDVVLKCRDDSMVGLEKPQRRSRNKVKEAAVSAERARLDQLLAIPETRGLGVRPSAIANVKCGRCCRWL